MCVRGESEGSRVWIKEQGDVLWGGKWALMLYKTVREGLCRGMYPISKFSGF